MNNFERRWQDGANLVFGLWLFISPWVLAYPDVLKGVSWNSWIIGLALAVLTITSIITRRKWQEFVNLVLGSWIFFTPVIFDMIETRTAAWNHYILGTLIVISAVWSISRSLKITRFRD